ncbi:hypothetical protein Tco_1173307, partial [Tanacetum coccineum]
FDTSAGNPVKEILLKLNLPDHRIFKDEGEGLWYPKRTRIEIIIYADSDHAGDYVDRKNIIGVRIFMGCCLTSWFSKKQAALAISTTEAKSQGISPSQLLNTPKLTPPPLTSLPPTPSQPSKQSSPLAINLDPVELIYSTPPTSPHPFFDSLEDLPPRTTNPTPLQSSFDTIKHLVNQPSPLSAMEPHLPLMPPHLLPLGSNNPFLVLTHEMFCDHYQRTQVIVNDLREEIRFILNHIIERLDVLAHKIHP